MDFDDIERLLELVREHDLAEFELEHDGLKLRVRKSPGGVPQLAPHIVAAPQITASSVPLVHASPQALPSAPTALSADDEELELAVVKSPIVGTFYRAADP